MDIHKRSVYITEMETDGTLKDRYEVVNSHDSWMDFAKRYQQDHVDIALETSTSGKYAARLLRDKGFSVHMADPSKLSLIFILQWKMIRKIHTSLQSFSD